MTDRDARLQAAEAEKARIDAWVGKMPGAFAGRQFAGLYREAVEMAGPRGAWRYLDLVREIDEGWVPGEALVELAAEVELANARSTREATRRAGDAAAAVLQRVDDIRLAVDALSAHPRVAMALDSGAGPGLSGAEVALELRARSA